MIEEADFQKVGNAAIDLCVFVDKLRLGEKHREEADKLTHNVLNLIKQTKKIEEEPLTKGNKMSKKLKIQFWKAEKALAMQILEQEGSFRDSKYVSTGYPELCCDRIYLCDEEERSNLGVAARHFDTNASRDEYLKTVIRWISEEQFGKNNEEMLKAGDLKIGEMCEVSDDGVSWHKYRLLAILPDRYEMRFIIENGTLSWCTCTYARPITKRTEPKIEECGQLITFTWEEK